MEARSDGLGPSTGSVLTEVDFRNDGLRYLSPNGSGRSVGLEISVGSERSVGLEISVGLERSVRARYPSVWRDPFGLRYRSPSPTKPGIAWD
jgi:hypothetical protein